MYTYISKIDIIKVDSYIKMTNKGRVIESYTCQIQHTQSYAHACTHTHMQHTSYKVARTWIGYYWLLPDIIGYFPYSFKIHELLGGKNVWK